MDDKSDDVWWLWYDDVSEEVDSKGEVVCSKKNNEWFLRRW